MVHFGTRPSLASGIGLNSTHLAFQPLLEGVVATHSFSAESEPPSVGPVFSISPAFAFYARPLHCFNSKVSKHRWTERKKKASTIKGRITQKKSIMFPLLG